MIARLGPTKVFRRRLVTSIIIKETAKRLDQLYTSLLDILIIFLDSENLFFLSLIN